MTPTFQTAIHSLNEQQRAAVLSEKRFLLILAGAGSGKTRTITVRIARLIADGVFRPWEILALTFTNKAAREMRERVHDLLDTDTSGVLVSTFHAFGARFLRQYHAYADLSRGFVIYDDRESVQLLQQCFPDHPRARIVSWAKAISRAKDQGLFPDDSLTNVSKENDFHLVYRQYQEALRSAGAVDFGDLLLLPIRVLRDHEDLRQKSWLQYKAILVDEYQDTNYAQFVLLQLLLSQTCELSVVGDDDQSIYQFRGAEIRNILDFPQHFSPCTTFRLEKNYRSTEEILKLAACSIAYNTDRHEKHLYGVGKTGGKPVIVVVPDDIQEAVYCVERIQKDCPTGSIAILYRRNAQSRLFESQLQGAQLPYQIVGSVRFWAREEIRDLMSFFSLLVNPRDIISFTRIINKPSRKIGAKSIQRIQDISLQKEITLLDALQSDAGSAKKAIDFTRIMEHLVQLLDAMQPFSKLIAYILQESGLKEIYAASGNEQTKMENIEELMRVCDEFEPTESGLQTLLEQFALDSSLDALQEGTRVSLMTIHSTKGLEFDHVFLTGVDEGLFPARVSADEIEEERRLFYVACTRARKGLTLTSSRYRLIHGRREAMQVSRFIEELDPSVYELSGSELRRYGVGFQKNRWNVGNLVYHPEYGSGRIAQAERRYGEEYVVVTFFDGRRGEFVPRYVKDLVKLDD